MIRLTVLLAALLAGAPAAWGQAFPAKPIELVIPFGAGGSADIEGRIIAKAAEKILGVPVVPINKPGAGGALAYTYVKNAAPDGYTVAWNSTSLLTTSNLGTLAFPWDGLDPVARTGVWERIAEVRERTGMTVLVTTHYMEEAQEHCDRVALMHRGRIRALGTPAELIDSLAGGGTLDDVFRAYTGDDLDGGKFRDVRATRRTAGRLG